MANVTAPQFQEDVNNTADWANGDENTTVTMRLGQTADSPAKTIADIKAEASEALGESQFYIKGAFADGFTIDYYFELGETATGEVYRYKRPNALPFVVPPGFDPSADSRFALWVDTDHNNLTNRNAPDSHPASAISTNGGVSSQYVIDSTTRLAATISDAADFTDASEGMTVLVSDRESVGDGRGAVWEFVLTSTVDPSETDAIVSSVDPTLTLVLRKKWGTENLKGYDAFDSNKSTFFAGSVDYQPNLVGVIHTGQSLAAGGVGADDIGTVYEPLNASRAFMLSGQPVHQRNGTWSKRLTALKERNFGEEDIRVTIASSFLNWVINKEVADQPGNKWVFNGHAWGAKNYADLKKGGATGVYEKVIDQVTDVLALQPSIEYPYFTCIHGETDGLNNNLNYEANLVEWRNDFDADIKALTGQSTDVHMFLCQTATAGGYDSNGGITDTDFVIPQSQLDADDNNTLITMVCSKYHLPYNDRSHITNLGQRTLGEYYGKALAKIRKGQTFNCVKPSSISRATPSSIQINFAGVIGNLVFDTTLVQAIANQGFDYVDDSANTITDVTITGPAQVTIQLSGTIGANPFVSYAYHNGAGGEVNQIAGLGDRGNLRDTDPARSRFDNSIRLYNWAVIFKKAVPA